MSEKRRVYGRIDLKGGDEATVTPTRSGAKTSSPSVGLGSGPRARVVVNNTQSRVGVESPLSRQDAGIGIGGSSSTIVPQSAYGGRVVAAGAAVTGARSSPTVGGPPARTSTTATGIAAAGGRARVLGYSNSPSSASPAGPSSTPTASCIAASSPFATPGATVSPLAHPLPASVSTKAFDRRVRAASTEPHDSPTASLARSHQSTPPGSAHAPARPGSPRRPFPTSRATTIPSSGARLNTDILGDGKSAPAADQSGPMPPPIRPRVKSRVTVADPTKHSYSLTSRPAAANGLLPPVSIASSSSSTSLGLGSSAGPGRLKTSSSAVFARSTTSSHGAGPAGPSAPGPSSARPASPVRQRPGCPLRRPASPVRPALSLARSLAPSAVASATTPTPIASPQRETQGASDSSPASPRRPAFASLPPRSLPNTLLPSSPSFSKLSASHASVPRQPTSTVTSSVNVKRPSTSSQSSSSSASYSTLSPEIFSDSAKTVRHTPKSPVSGLSPVAVASSHFQRARRRSRSHSVNSSISSLSGVSGGGSQAKGKGRERHAGSGETSTPMDVSGSVTEGDEVLQSPLQYAARPASHGTASLATLESPRVPTEDDLLKEKEYRDAKTKRKILDLEITNTSLLAINSSLEKAKVKQSAEIRSLRRQLRERASLAPLHSSSLPLLSPATDEYGFATSPDPDNGAEWGEEREMDWDEILRLDGQFADVVRLLEGLNRRAKTALEAAPESVEAQPGRGGKVLNAFDVEEERRRRAREERDSGVAGVTALADLDRDTEIDGDSEGDRLDENDTTIASSSVASSVDEEEAEESRERENANVSGVGGFTLDSPELSLGVD